MPQISRREACRIGGGLSLLAIAQRAAATQKNLSCERWGVAEIVLNGPSDGAPDRDVRLAATFRQGGYEITVPGFYDGNALYRIRFCPPETGNWTWCTTSNCKPLDSRTGSLTVAAPAKNNHGPVRVTGDFHFSYADGTPFHQIGTTSYGWVHQPTAMRALTLQTLAASPFNKIRFAIFPNGTLNNAPLYPFAGTAEQWDFDHFNPAFFHRIEEAVVALGRLGIEADIILFHPYDADRWGFDRLPDAVNTRYLHHVVARLGAYRNVWWSIANEYDDMKYKTEADFDHYFQIVEATDVAGHLRSIHHMRKFYNNTKPWVTHASIQSGAIAADDERAMILRDIWRKPVILDEVKYEGNHSARWAQLSGEELVSRFWYGTIAGVYVGHSEFFEDEAHHMWLGTGGVLRGTSTPRLAFLRKILQEGPPQTDPIDKWQDHHLGGVAGSYYLKYFGAEAPASWRFILPKDGLKDGDSFTADILDTWNMTITPVPGRFIARAQGKYDFSDDAGRSIPLPGRSWMAIRIRKI